MTYLFIDTNVLLHYRRIEDIDWLNLSGANAVVIILCPTVVREMDRHKISHSQSKFRKRAQEIITSLHSRLSGSVPKVIREKVQIEFVAHDPELDFAAYK